MCKVHSIELSKLFTLKKSVCVCTIAKRVVYVVEHVLYVSLKKSAQIFESAKIKTAYSDSIFNLQTLELPLKYCGT